MNRCAPAARAAPPCWAARRPAPGADPDWFPDDGLVHRDLHTDNVLIDGGAPIRHHRLGGGAGDHRFDLVAFAFDLDGHSQPIWDVVDAAGFGAAGVARLRRFWC